MCSVMHSQAPGDKVEGMEELTCFLHFLRGVSVNQIAAKPLPSNPRVCYGARKQDGGLEGPG